MLEDSDDLRPDRRPRSTTRPTTRCAARRCPRPRPAAADDRDATRTGTPIDVARRLARGRRRRPRASGRSSSPTTQRDEIVVGRRAARRRAAARSRPSTSTTCRCRRCADALDRGRRRTSPAAAGFVLLRGFPTDLLDDAEIELAYVGARPAPRHTGEPGRRRAPCSVTCATSGVERTGPEVRLYRTRERQDFHTDGADIIGLLCLHAARVGRREQARQQLRRLQRDPPPPTRPARRALRADVVGPQRRGVTRRATRPSRCRSSTTSTARRAIFYIGWYIRDAQRHPRRPAAHRRAARGARPHRDHRQRPRLPRRDGLPARRRPTAQQRQDPPLPRGLRRRTTTSTERRHLLRLWLAPTTSPASRTHSAKGSRNAERNEETDG